MQDEACMQDLHEVGVYLPFKGNLSTVLAPPSAGFYAKIEHAQAATYDEVQEGILSAPLMGLHLLPCKFSARNVVSDPAAPRAATALTHSGRA